MENKQKRYYKKGETVWIVDLKREGVVTSISKDSSPIVMTVKFEDRGQATLYTDNIWKFDKLKYNAKEKQEKKTVEKKPQKVTYFSSVQGGIIPDKIPENAGRDCYARLEPKLVDGKEVFELILPHLKLTKIPLGFASYLNQDDVLSLKHERSSIGGTGLINVSGLIDSTFQGEVILQVVPLVCDVVISSEVDEKFYDEKNDVYFVPYHKAIAQAVIFKLSEAKDVVIPYPELLSKPSTRGTGGWGSSGK